MISRRVFRTVFSRANVYIYAIIYIYVCICYMLIFIHSNMVICNWDSLILVASKPHFTTETSPISLGIIRNRMEHQTWLRMSQDHQTNLWTLQKSMPKRWHETEICHKSPTKMGKFTNVPCRVINVWEFSHECGRSPIYLIYQSVNLCSLYQVESRSVRQKWDGQDAVKGHLWKVSLRVDQLKVNPVLKSLILMLGNVDLTFNSS